MTQNPSPKPSPVYLKTEQAAEIAQLAQQTLINWRYRRKGPPWIKVGGSVRYEQSALYAWLDAQTHTEIPPASGM